MKEKDVSKEGSKKKNKNAEKAESFLMLLGGKENIEDVTNCATRLRITIKDESKVAPDSEFRKVGAHGLVVNGKAIQVIVGLSVPTVREEFENLL
jgi:PTS system arbutin-like IIC component